MNALVIIGHQRQGSFCHAIAETAVDTLTEGGHEVVFHDLYAEAFDPILHQEEIPKTAILPPIIRQHCEELVAADGIVVVHPNWWGQPPAILKGWIDRVVRQGLAYDFGEKGKVIGFLKGKRALVLTTSNTPREAEIELYGDPLENLWKNCIWGFCGIEDFRRRNFESMVVSTPQQRAGWLEEVRRLTAECFAPRPADRT